MIRNWSSGKADVKSSWKCFKTGLVACLQTKFHYSIRWKKGKCAIYWQWKQNEIDTDEDETLSATKSLHIFSKVYRNFVFGFRQNFLTMKILNHIRKRLQRCLHTMLDKMQQQNCECRIDKRFAHFTYDGPSTPCALFFLCRSVFCKTLFSFSLKIIWSTEISHWIETMALIMSVLYVNWQRACNDCNIFPSDELSTNSENQISWFPIFSAWNRIKIKSHQTSFSNSIWFGSFTKINYNNHILCSKPEIWSAL